MESVHAAPYGMRPLRAHNALLEPHPSMPKATARRGTRRMPSSVRSLLVPALPRDRALELIDGGELQSARCSVVWNVADRPLVQRAGDLDLPSTLDLIPIRRVGTYRGAPNAIAMYPTVRDGYALMLTVESRLELAWLQQLACDRRNDALYAQPFLLLWTHEEGVVWRVPDLAVRRAGHLAVYDVKHPDRVDDPWTRATFDLTAAALNSASVDYEVLSEMSPQRAHNLQLISRYRQANPTLAVEVEAVLERRPRTAGGLIEVVWSVTTGRAPSRLGRPVFTRAALARGQAVLHHVLATGDCLTDLDRPLSLVSQLTWSDHALSQR